MGVPILGWIDENLLDGAGSDMWEDYTGVTYAKESASATAQSQREAQAFQQQQFDQAQQLAQPYLQGSEQMYGQLINELTGQGPSQFKLTPQYQSAMQAGLESVNQGAAGAGMLMSGSRLQGLQQTGQNIQNQAYGDYLNRLMSVGNSQTAMQLGTAGMGMGQNIAAQLMQSQQLQNLALAEGEAGRQGAVGDLIGAGTSFIGGLL